MAKSNKIQKKKPTKKGFLSRLFTTSGSKKAPATKAAPSPKKASPASPKKALKSPGTKKIVTKKSASPATSSKKTIKKPPERKKATTAPVKRMPPSPMKPEPIKEFVVESSYTPEPFKGSSFTLQPKKILTSEGWLRLVEFDPPFYT